MEEVKRDEYLKKLGSKLFPDMTEQEFFDIYIQGKGVTSKDLLDMEFPEPSWVIKDLIPEGLTIFSGKPKIGKSWLALQIAADVSVGNKILKQFDSTPMRTIYLALEDTERRLQNRYQKIEGIGSENLCFYTEWSRGMTGIAHLKKRLESKKFADTKLIVIDTIGKFLPEIDMNSYSEVYPAMSNIKRLADEFHIAIICLHHTKKSISDDYIDNVSGSNAFAGASDTILVLERSRGDADAYLKASGRDIDDRDIALELVKDKGWGFIGDGKEYRMSRERREIIEILKEADTPLRANEIAAMVNKSYGSVRLMLARMANEGQIDRTHRGLYQQLVER